MNYEPKSPIKNTSDKSPDAAYVPKEKIPNEGKTEYTGDTNWNAVNRGFPPHKGKEEK